MRLGTWPTLLLNRPDHIEEVLVRNHSNFVKHSFFWRHVTALFGKGLLTSEGEFWQKQRRLAAPAFSNHRLAGYSDTMVRHTVWMLEDWKPGETRNIHRELMGLTYRIAAKTLFDSDIEQNGDDIHSDVNAAVREIASRLARPFVIPDALPLPGHIRYRRVVRRIDRFIAQVIEKQRTRPKNQGDLLSTLIDARDESGRPMPDRQLRDEAVTLLLAGHETTALALSWTFYLLGQHPDIDAELAAEVLSVLNGREATVDDLPHLRFTEHVIMEAMRLYPPAWFFGREALHDCAIGGYPVRAGTTVLMSPWVLHRDPRYYDEACAFQPGRWSNDLVRRLPRFAYMPFGGGPRICIGNRFAMMEAVLILATVIQRFRLEWQSDRPVVPRPSITLRPQGGVWVRLWARP
jgi:cytochrome P450